MTRPQELVRQKLEQVIDDLSTGVERSIVLVLVRDVVVRTHEFTSLKGELTRDEHVVVVHCGGDGDGVVCQGLGEIDGSRIRRFSEDLRDFRQGSEPRILVEDAVHEVLTREVVGLGSIQGISILGETGNFFG